MTTTRYVTYLDNDMLNSLINQIADQDLAGAELLSGLVIILATSEPNGV